MKENVGKEAFLMLTAFLEDGLIQTGILEDVSEEIDVMDAAQLMDIIGRASSRLKQLERQNESAAKETVLKIDSSFRIFLDGEKEMVMRPIPKTIFILFLKHPEGIEFRNLHRYRTEMLDIYHKISPRLDKEGMERSIDLLLSRGSNSLRENKSRLTRSLEQYFDKKSLAQYQIDGERAGLKRISLDRTFVEWDYNNDFE